MSVLIKGMDMPSNCWECALCIGCDNCEGYTNECAATRETLGYNDETKAMTGRLEDCPLVEVEEVKGYAGYGTPNQRNVTILCVPNTTRAIEGE